MPDSEPLSLTRKLTVTTFPLARRLDGFLRTIWERIRDCHFAGVIAEEKSPPLVLGAAVLVAMAVSGVCMGTIMPNFAAAAMVLAPPALRGRISGVLVASIFAGQFLSPVVSQPLISASGFEGAYAVVGTIVLVIGITAFAARLLLRRPGDRSARARGEHA